MSKLGLAISIAASLHRDQTDKAGEPYILHCLTVMNTLKVKGVTDEDTLIIAVLHDMLEDTTIDRETIMKWFGWNVLRGVQRLTKRKGESYSDYLERVSLSKETILVKMADLEHNSDIRRIKGLTEKDFHRTIKYQRAYTYLKEKLEEF